jgi:hypothetical protein
MGAGRKWQPPAEQTVWQTANSLRNPSDELAESSSSRDLSVKSTTIPRLVMVVHDLHWPSSRSL